MSRILVRLSRFLFVFNLIVTVGCFIVWLWLFGYLKNRASETIREISSTYPSRAPSQAVSRRNSINGRTQSMVRRLSFIHLKLWPISFPWLIKVVKRLVHLSTSWYIMYIIYVPCYSIYNVGPAYPISTCGIN